MTISNETVEAAADYLPHSTDCEWRPERDCTCRHLRTATMRAALEAAAPHMVADAGAKALEDAADAAFKDKGIQGLRRVLTGNWLRARAAAVRGDDAHD